MDRRSPDGTPKSGTGSQSELIAVLDDEPLVLRTLERILGPSGCAVATSTTTEALDTWLGSPSLRVVLLDLCIGDTSGLDVLDGIKERRPDVQVVMITGRGSIDTAVECMRRGAFDFLCKPFSDIDKVRQTVASARASGRPLAPTLGLTTPLVSGDWTRVTLTGERVPEKPMPARPDPVPLSLDAYMRLALERALREANGDARQAAQRLGIGRSTFYRKAAKLGIDLARFDERSGDRDESPAPRVGGGPPIG